MSHDFCFIKVAMNVMKMDNVKVVLKPVPMKKLMETGQSLNCNELTFKIRFYIMKFVKKFDLRMTKLDVETLVEFS